MTHQFSSPTRTAWLRMLAAGAAMCAATLTLADDNANNAPSDDSADVADTLTTADTFTLDQSVSLVAGFYYPREFCPEPKFGADLDVPEIALLYTPGVVPLTLTDSILRSAALVSLKQTDTFIDRLAELEKLEILPLLRTDSASVYFGINRDGRVGMHINSRE